MRRTHARTTFTKTAVAASLAACLILTLFLVGAPETQAQGDPSKVTFTMSLTGIVNGVPIEVIGQGIADEDQGTLLGDYQLSTLPDGFEPRILNAFVITGHNSVSRNLAGTVNPFRAVTHGYTRTLDFQDGNRLVLQAHCLREGNKITSNFTLNGTVSVPPLERLEPLVEVWSPQGPGKLLGVFTVSWVANNGQRIQGTATTHYELPPTSVLPQTLHRFVTIQSKVSGTAFEQTQQVTLFKDFPGHLGFHSMGKP